MELGNLTFNYYSFNVIKIKDVNTKIILRSKLLWFSFGYCDNKEVELGNLTHNYYSFNVITKICKYQNYKLSLLAFVYSDNKEVA